jgi:membrane-bound lytic murein transglycosylase D
VALEVLTLIAALLLPGAPSERETLDRLEAEVFGAAGGAGDCAPGEPGCMPLSSPGSWLDTPDATPQLAGAAPVEFLRGARLDGFTVPVVLNGPVKAYIRFFQGRGKYILARWLSRMGRHRARIEALLAREGAPRELVYVAMIESGFDPTAVSRAQAVGPWQFVLKSGQAMGLRRDDWTDERRSWTRSTQAAARYLQALQKQFGSWPLALAAYNCGPGTVGRALQGARERDFWALSAAGALPLGTTRYVPKIMAAMIIGEDPARYGFGDVKPETPEETAEVHIPGGRDLRALARTLDIDPEHLADLNPELRRGYTPPGVTEWPILIPAAALDRFNEHVDTRDIQGRVFEEHRVRFGERLKDIAQAQGITQSTLRRLNELPEGEPRAGQTILVPADARKPAAPDTRPLLVRTDPGLTVSAAGRRELFFPVPDKMEVGEIAAFFGVSTGDVGLWNGLDPQAPVHRGMALRLFVAPEFDVSTALVVPADQVTVVPAGSAAADNALTQSRETRLPGTRRIAHTVRKGETLWKIAKRYGVSLQVLRAENGLGPRDAASPGKVLQVPSTERPAGGAASAGEAPARRPRNDARTYRIQKGDTLSRIARRMKISEAALRKANGFERNAALRVGRVITLP